MSASYNHNSTEAPFQKKLVSIVIVNYNGAKYLKKLFESLLNQTFTDFQIIFVDNASSDNSLQIAHEFFSSKALDIFLIENRENTGFCVGNNMAFSIASGDYVVLLNNDTYVEPDWLDELIKRVQFKDSPGIVVSKIITNGLPNYGSFFDIYGASLARSSPTDQNFFYGCGASLLIKKELIQKTGGLDPDFFMYKDDPDICWRVKLLDQNIVCAQKSTCYHLKPSSDGAVNANLDMPVWEFRYAHARNRFRLLLKNYSCYNLLKRLPVVFLIVNLRALFLSFRNKNSLYITEFLKGILWNLKVLKGTLQLRQKIQTMRKVSDKQIEKYLITYSLELWSLKLLFCRLTPKRERRK